MGSAADRSDAEGTWQVPPDRRLADRPIAFLKAQIEFLRHLSGLLDAIRRGNAADEDAETVYQFLCCDLGQLLQDRRANLLPVLRRRATEDDDVEQLVVTLERDYHGVEQEAEHLAQTLARRLEAAGGRRAIGDPAGGLAQRLKHMVAFESAILIPLVRVRLSDEDRDLLAAAFQARREPRPPSSGDKS